MPPMSPKSDTMKLPVLGSTDAQATAPAEVDPMDVLLETGRAAAVESEGAYGKSYWRSIEEKLQTPEFLESTRGEFPPGADLPPEGVDRRNFLQLLGASMALAGFGTACSTRPDDERMLPYTKVPDGLSPGVPQHYASALTTDGLASAVLIQSWEGRPTKITGNPEHPISQGTTHAFEQARLMDLYNPARAQTVRHQRKPAAYASFTEDLTSRLKTLQAEGGAKLHFLVGPSGSPTQASLEQRIKQRFPKARFHAWTSASRDAATRGAEIAFGRPLDPHFEFEQADIVVSFDADFLQRGADAGRHMRDFGKRRDPKNPFNRFYQIESTFSATGVLADHRLRVQSARVADMGRALAAALGVPGISAPSLNADQKKWIDTAAADLRGAGAKGLVLAGERQPPAVHALAYAINAQLGSIGTTVRFTEPLLNHVTTSTSSLQTLTQAIDAGEVDTLFITAHDPVYGAPVDLDFLSRLQKVPYSIYTSLFEDQTSAAVTWFVPATHETEAWADNRSADGTITFTQPLINPLYPACKSELELLDLFLSQPYRSNYQIVRDHWLEQTGAAGFQARWETWVQMGFQADTALPSVTPDVAGGAVSSALAALPKPKDGLELNFRRSDQIDDGRYFNNPYLQESPEPLTKIVWDNAALVSPRTAERLNVKTNDVVELAYRGKTLEAPIFILPSHADDAVTVALGYGKVGAFRYQDAQPTEKVGFNAGLLRHQDAVWFDGGLEIRTTKKKYELVQTQTHWSMEDPVPAGLKSLVRKRPIALETTLAAWKSEPGKLTEPLRHLGARETLLKPLEPRTGPALQQWGMAIDLSRCTGCNGCVVSCQVENNIPVVGRDQVHRGREMTWLRMDRYFSGDLEDATVIMQGIACVHCEKAPCEYVCPVNATVHSDEGLNLMVYNRCVGTRYCSNNCPYKVRRFNYLHYSSGKSATERMSMNPDVTVRARGVMEKCTYCVQRIQRARITARIDSVQTGKGDGRIPDGAVRTACQEACSANAIVFGDLADPDSAVSKLHEDPRSYRLLNDLGTLPRTRHLARINNPNPALVAQGPTPSEH